MGQSTISLNFHPSTVEGKAGSLYWLFYKDGKTIEVGTRQRIYPEEWDRRGKKIVIDTADPSRATYLVKLVGELTQEMEDMRRSAREMEYDDPDCTVDDIRELYGTCGCVTTLSGYAYQLGKALDKAGRERTADAYRSVAKKVQKYNNGKDVRLDGKNA